MATLALPQMRIIYRLHIAGGSIAGIMGMDYWATTLYTGMLMKQDMRDTASETIEPSIELDALAVGAKASDAEMERLIARFGAYLRSCASRYGVAFDESQREDMYGNAMMAFYEAVQKYDPERGHFFPFANQTVRTRMIDFIRKARKQEGFTVPLEDDDNESASPQSAAIAQLSIRTYEKQQTQEHLADEIAQLQADLAGWGITMYALTEHSPKHSRLREEYDAVVEKMLQTPDIMQTIQLKRYLPIKTIARMTGVSTKKLERARHYLLASIIILMGDYEYLSEYVSDRRYRT